MDRPKEPKVPLLSLDPSLGDGLDAETLGIAARAIGVETLTIGSGEWPAPASSPGPGSIGFLIVEGVMAREVLVAGDRSVELLTAGDIVVPWQDDAASFVEVKWLVLEELRLAVLDRSVAAGVAQVPELLSALLSRALNRARALAVHAAIAGMPGLEDRLLTLFWQLAERCGSLAEGGAWMPLRLTHQMLADIVGARRPSVTVALGVLVDEGLLTLHAEGGWMLTGEPPDPHRSPRSRTSA